MFTSERSAIEKLDGTLVAERHAPKDSFVGPQMSTPWDPLHRAYFNGEALWTYLTTPFLLTLDGVRVEEMESWQARRFIPTVTKEKPAWSSTKNGVY
jgi:hypothetical protein